MAELLTKPTGASVDAFLSTVEPQRRREDTRRMCAIVAEVTGETPVMWGASIIGFGGMHYTYATGRELDWMKIGVAPRKAALTLYGLREAPGAAALLAKLGSHGSGSGCLYVKKLEDVDEAVLRELVALAYARGDFVA
jgi:hypothetical protein